MSVKVPARVERLKCPLELTSANGTKVLLTGGLQMLVHMRAHARRERMTLGECAIALDCPLTLFPHAEWDGVLNDMIEWLLPANDSLAGDGAIAGYPAGSRFGRIKISLYGTVPGDGGVFVDTEPFPVLACFLPEGSTHTRIVLGVPGNAGDRLGEVKLDVRNELALIEYLGNGK